jgi:hypothetical protein
LPAEEGPESIQEMMILYNAIFLNALKEILKLTKTQICLHAKSARGLFMLVVLIHL